MVVGAGVAVVSGVDVGYGISVGVGVGVDVNGVIISVTNARFCVLSMCIVPSLDTLLAVATYC